MYGDSFPKILKRLKAVKGWMVKIAQNKTSQFFDGSLAAETQHRTIPCDDGDDNDDGFYRRKDDKERELVRFFSS